MVAELKIGQVARLSGVGVETIRYYERRGLVDRPKRPRDGGYRIYGSDTISRIRFIRSAQRLGFTLSEIQGLLSLQSDPSSDCADVRKRAIEKRDAVTEKISRLSEIHGALNDIIATCPGSGAVGACTIIEHLENHAATRADASPDIEHTDKNEMPMRTTILTIKGMHCDGCARTVEALLGRVPGVRKVKASYDKREARVLHDQNDAKADDLAAAVAKGGFTAKAAGQ